MSQSISGFCRRRTIELHDTVLMFCVDGLTYASLDTPIGDSVFMVLTEEEWEAHRMVMKPTMVEDEDN